MTQLVHVPVAALPLERFGEVLDGDAYRDLAALQVRAERLLAGRVVWCVNSTAHGGGVAEMLRSLLAYTRGAGVDSRWSVLTSDAAFFAITKRLHNRLHGAIGDVDSRWSVLTSDAAFFAITKRLHNRLRPLVVSGVGGIQDQISDGVDGLVVEPRDLAGFGAAVGRLLGDDVLAARLGAAARARARSDFLEPRHLRQWVDILARLIAAEPDAALGQPAG